MAGPMRRFGDGSGSRSIVGTGNSRVVRGGGADGLGALLEDEDEDEEEDKEEEEEEDEDDEGDRSRLRFLPPFFRFFRSRLFFAFLCFLAFFAFFLAFFSFFFSFFRSLTCFLAMTFTSSPLFSTSE
mmetsp:Transcript_12650/g.28300  ORF Transcript_12650/g.28300 Transcript_12650/m.28300 type:complete len:127 (-) Transcript_12650:357-737(-)